MSSLGNVLRSAPRHVALGTVIGAAMAFLPADADQHASAVAMVTATVHMPVTISGGRAGGAEPTVHSAAPRAYSLRMIHGELDGDNGRTANLRTIFVDFD
jgi:hypothetical protein